jgi:glycosyltransferase involved in cell wall biosynthesis
VKITFVLPCPSWVPYGGFKVVYEYANRLTKRGHSLTIIHPFYLQWKNISRIKSMRVIANYFRHLLKSYIKPPWHWFTINPGVRMIITPNLEKKWIPDADAIVATLWNTAECIALLNPQKGRKFYFIQGLDTIFNQTTPVRAMNTWKLPLKKIVISRWLKQIAENRGECCTYIPDGLNFNEFAVEIPIEKRNTQTVCLIYSKDTLKGTIDGLRALQIVKEKVPGLSIIMFGVGPEPETTLSSVTYYQKPTTNQIKEIFNTSAIFIGTSWCEGFGLPPCEAAACGAALCVADNGGHREFAIHEKTALVHPPRRPDILAANILCLLNDNEKRIKIARAGNSYVKKFSWDRSVQEFEQAIEQGIIQERAG